MLEQHVIDEIIFLRSEGYTIRHIKEKLNLNSTSIVHRYIHDSGKRFVKNSVLRSENKRLREENKILKKRLQQQLRVFTQQLARARDIMG